ncbi:MAG: hypothetical protein J7K96_02255, partial [Desulfobacteraceae bacterium]|nr:hypothetical protein [Desulfobacteraceae bacterium]
MELFATPSKLLNRLILVMNDYQKHTCAELTFSDIHVANELFGAHNCNLKRIAEATDVTISARGNTISITGDTISSDLAKNILNQLYGLIKDGYPVYAKDVEYATNVLSRDSHVNLKNIFLDTVYVTSKKTTITPKNPNQKAYIDAIRNFDIAFG